MSKIKYIILGIISSFANSLPISYNAHIKIYDNIFNTKIFNDQYLTSFLNISLIIAILIINYKELINFSKKILKKQKIKKKHHFLKILTISSFISIFFIPFNKCPSNIKLIAIFYLLTSIILLFSNNKKGNRKITDLNLKDSFIIGLFNITSIIPTISPLCSNIFICSKRKIDKSLSFIYSTLCYIPILLINSIKGITFLLNNQTYILDYSISLIISTFLSIYFLNYLKKLYYSNKMYKLSFYCIFLTIFLLIWFR